MRLRFSATVMLLAGCATAPPVEPVSPPAQQVVVVEKPIIVEKRVVVEKPVIVERRVIVEKPIAAPHRPRRSPCAGLLEPACKAPTCRWVKHARPTDTHGRPLTDYCRLRGKA